MSTLADRLLRHVLSFSLDGVVLPPGVSVLDPFNGDHGPGIQRIVTDFHRTFHGDDGARSLMLGINPGRLGAGSTGLGFTDTKRCESDLGIPVGPLHTHEPSSDFFYRMIRAAGGARHFYGQVYVHSVCPWGFVKTGANDAAVNLNYYDDPALEKAVMPFMEHWLQTLAGVGMRTDVVFCIGTGKNAKAFKSLNDRLELWDRIVPLEHPRYVMQYKARQVDVYIDKYLTALREAGYR